MGGKIFELVYKRQGPGWIEYHYREGFEIMTKCFVDWKKYRSLSLACASCQIYSEVPDTSNVTGPLGHPGF